MPIASKNINAEKIQGNLDITTVSASAFTGSFIGDGAGLYNLPIPIIDTASLLTTASFNAYTGSNTSQFAGTASFAYSSSDAITASYYAETDPVFTAVSGTFTTTASFGAFTASYYVDSASIVTEFAGLAEADEKTIELDIINNVIRLKETVAAPLSGIRTFEGDVVITGSLTVNNSITASLHGTASFATNSSVSISSSFSETASFVTASNVHGPYGSNSIITASYAVAALSSSYALSASHASHADSSSYATTSSYALNALSSSYASFATSASFAATSTNTSDILIYVKNVTGVPIPKGKVVRISGATGDNALISTASWESDAMSANTLGILNEFIDNDAFGYAMTEGTLLGINTDAFTPGQLLYLGPTGSIIGHEPKAPLHAVRLGQALRIQQNNGSMYVRIDNGYELDELHNVLIISGSDGDLLVASGSNNNGKKLYINSKQLTGSYGLTGSLTATSFTGSLRGTASYADVADSVDDLNQAVYISGSLTVVGPATFYGTASFIDITASNLYVSESWISVNVFEPVERFGGLKIYDSGSSSATASFAWDSLHNHFVYQNVSGSLYTGGMFLSGPRNTGSLGDEPTLEKWFIPRSDGGDHLENTQIYSSGSTHIITGSLTVTAGITASLQGTASWANNAVTASFITASSVSGPYGVNSIISSSYAVTASYIDGGFY